MKGEYLKLDTIKTMAELLNENKKLRDIIHDSKEYIEDNSTDKYLLKSFDVDMLIEILNKGEQIK